MSLDRRRGGCFRGSDADKAIGSRRDSHSGVKRMEVSVLRRQGADVIGETAD